MGNVKYEFDPVNKSLWRIDGENYTLAEHLSVADHQLLLNSLVGGDPDSVSMWGGDHDVFIGQTLPAPKLDLAPVQTVTLGRIPTRKSEAVSHIGVMPRVQIVNFDETVKRPSSTNPFEDMPEDGKDLLQFINNAIAMKKAESRGTSSPGRRNRFWR